MEKLVPPGRLMSVTLPDPVAARPAASSPLSLPYNIWQETGTVRFHYSGNPFALSVVASDLHRQALASLLGNAAVPLENFPCFIPPVVDGAPPLEDLLGLPPMERLVRSALQSQFPARFLRSCLVQICYKDWWAEMGSRRPKGPPATPSPPSSAVAVAGAGEAPSLPTSPSWGFSAVEPTTRAVLVFEYTTRLLQMASRVALTCAKHNDHSSQAHFVQKLSADISRSATTTTSTVYESSRLPEALWHQSMKVWKQASDQELCGIRSMLVRTSGGVNIFQVAAANWSRGVAAAIRPFLTEKELLHFKDGRKTQQRQGRQSNALVAEVEEVVDAQARYWTAKATASDEEKIAGMRLAKACGEAVKPFLCLPPVTCWAITTPTGPTQDEVEFKPAPAFGITSCTRVENLVDLAGDPFHAPLEMTLPKVAPTISSQLSGEHNGGCESNAAGSYEDDLYACGILMLYLLVGDTLINDFLSKSYLLPRAVQSGELFKRPRDFLPEGLEESGAMNLLLSLLAPQKVDTTDCDPYVAAACAAGLQDRPKEISSVLQHPWFDEVRTQECDEYEETLMDMAIAMAEEYGEQDDAWSFYQAILLHLQRATGHVQLSPVLTPIDEAHDLERQVLVRLAAASKSSTTSEAASADASDSGVFSGGAIDMENSSAGFEIEQLVATTPPPAAPLSGPAVSGAPEGPSRLPPAAAARVTAAPVVRLAALSPLSSRVSEEEEEDGVSPMVAAVPLPQPSDRIPASTASPSAPSVIPLPAPSSGPSVGIRWPPPIGLTPLNLAGLSRSAPKKKALPSLRIPTSTSAAGDESFVTPAGVGGAGKPSEKEDSDEEEDEESSSVDSDDF
jgi:hypothetical protein